MLWGEGTVMPDTQPRVSDLELVRQAWEMPSEMSPAYNYFGELSMGN
jgi:hypothetical protein